MENLNAFYFCVLVIKHILVNVACASGNFDPFMDSNLFSIKWQGQLQLTREEIELLGDRHLMITTNAQEQYHCILPEDKKPSQQGSSEHVGPSVDDLMKPLFKQSHCSYRIESYWTYELCHGRHLRQYHETKEQGMQPRVQEYYLGYGNHRESMTEDSRLDEQTHIPVREVEGISLPYYEVVMGDGTKCDLTGKPRTVHVLYVCHVDGRGEVYEFKESSTCVYEVVVLTALLCKHPSYKPKTQPVSEIRCHAMDGSPLKPSELTSIEYETRNLQTVGKLFPLWKCDLGYEHLAGTNCTCQAGFDYTHDYINEDNPVEERKPQFIRKQPQEKEAPKTQPDPQSQLGALTDKQTLRDFLTGSQCLRGGTGWWKHEICFGKFVKQFHIEGGKENNIFLGYWDKEKHITWLQNNPNKKPRPAEGRKILSLYYSGGDTCDLTKKPRNCEVRLKCLQNFKIPHAVALSLAEPESCQYVLTVESALFCPILKDADENGLFENLDI